jgi:NhaP-type Na+/H+ or K+/H+ antiporter
VVRRLASMNMLTLVFAAVTVVAAGVLFTFPGDPRVWGAATWIFVLGLLVLAALVIGSGYRLARHQTARNWRSIVVLTIGLACLAPVVTALLLAG